MLQINNQQRMRVCEPPSLPVACDAGLTAGRSGPGQAMPDIYGPFETVAHQPHSEAP